LSYGWLCAKDWLFGSRIIARFDNLNLRMMSTRAEDIEHAGCSIRVQLGSTASYSRLDHHTQTFFCPSLCLFSSAWHWLRRPRPPMFPSPAQQLASFLALRHDRRLGAELLGARRG